MSNKNNKKHDELLDKKCGCNKEICDCENLEVEEEDSFEDLITDDFSGTYTVSFDGLYDEVDSLEDECELDTKKLALVGLGALLVGGALCYAVKKKNKK